jgi:hypothetical protein
MGKGMFSLCFVFLCSSLSYGFISAPLDSPVVVDYTPTGGSTGLNQGRGTARDSRGWIFAVYIMDNNYLVQLSRSTDNGRTWSRFALLYNPWSMYPNIVIDRGDSIYVDWERQPVDTIGRDIYFSKYNGVSWSPAVNVSNEHGLGSNVSSSLALDGSGMLHLTWLGYGPDIWYSYYVNNVWSTKENVTQGTGSWVASMCADTANNLHLAWQGWEIQYKKRSGGVWGPTEQASPFQGFSPCIVTDSQCRPQIVYTDSLRFISYGLRDSSGWEPPQQISDTTGWVPSITCDKYGHLYAVWYGPEVGKGKLYYATYDGTAWSPPVRIRNDTAYGDWAPRLGFPVSDSGVDLIWTMNNPSGSGYRVMYWRLPLLPVGVEQGRVVPSPLSPLPISVFPNPFFSFATVPGYDKETFALYDVSGRKVGVYKGNRIGVGLSTGVYFLKPEGQDAKPIRIVKLR